MHNLVNATAAPAVSFIREILNPRISIINIYLKWCSFFHATHSLFCKRWIKSYVVKINLTALVKNMNVVIDNSVSQSIRDANGSSYRNFSFISLFLLPFSSLWGTLFSVNFSYRTLVHLALRMWKIYERIFFFFKHYMKCWSVICM